MSAQSKDRKGMDNMNNEAPAISSLQMNPNFKPAGNMSADFKQSNAAPTPGVKFNGKEPFGGKAKR